MDNVNTTDFIQSQTKLYEKLTLQPSSEDAKLSEEQLNAIETLAKLDGRSYLSRAIEHAVQALQQSVNRLQTVTRAECELVNLRDDQLPHLDRGLVDSVIKQMQEASGASSANVRRADKTYSYKEQMAELELKKELEAKRAAKNKDKKDETDPYSIEKVRAAMSKKQQEQLDLQVQRELRIREEMRGLDAQVRRCTQILVCVAHGNVVEAKLYLTQIVRCLFKLVGPPLFFGHLISRHISYFHLKKKKKKAQVTALHASCPHNPEHVRRAGLLQHERCERRGHHAQQLELLHERSVLHTPPGLGAVA